MNMEEISWARTAYYFGSCIKNHARIAYRRSIRRFYHCCWLWLDTAPERTNRPEPQMRHPAEQTRARVSDAVDAAKASRRLGSSTFSAVSKSRASPASSSARLVCRSGSFRPSIARQCVSRLDQQVFPRRQVGAYSLRENANRLGRTAGLLFSGSSGHENGGVPEHRH